MGALTTRLAASLFLCVGLSVNSVSAEREEPLSAVADLRYGTALYHYFLDDYMSAMTELLIAEEKGGIEGHGPNPEIMEGGLAMGYAMERYASEIFDRLLADNRSIEARDAAWLYLARIRYTHGDWARAEAALDKISPEPNKNLRRNALALRINVVLKQDRPSEAVELLRDKKLVGPWLPYFYFNIGSAFARLNDYESAIQFFSRFSSDDFQKSYRIEEHQALYDKAMTAAGFAHLFLKRPAEAKEYFSRVRLTSSLKNRALLGYGWAAVELGDYKEALKPWLHLANSPLIDENNQEALIAVPYAYEKMGAESLALERYQLAEKSFLIEIEKIDEVLATLNSEDLLDALKIEARGRIDWLAVAEEQQLSPRLTYLVRLFSQDRFQASIYELQDLITIRDDLVEWQDKLAFYSDMVDSREIFRAEQSEFLKVSELKNRIETMQEARATYTAQIEEIQAEHDFFALANEEEKDLINRAQRSLENVEKLRDSDPFIDEYEESVRRYHGLLVWQVSEKYSERLWVATKKINSLDKAIKEATNAESRVAVIMSTSSDLNPYRVKMDKATAELLQLNDRIDEVIRRNEIDLRGKVAQVLQQQRVRLLNYLGQSRLSIARIYDKARNQYQDSEFEQLKSDAQRFDKRGSGGGDKNTSKLLAPTLETLEASSNLNENPEDGSGVDAKDEPDLIESTEGSK